MDTNILSAIKNIDSKLSTYGTRPSYGQRITSTRFTDSLGTITSRTQKLIALAGIICVFVLLIVVCVLIYDSYYPFLYLYSEIFNAGSPMRTQLYWTNAIPENTDPPSNLVITEEDSIAKKPNYYSVMFDFYIADAKAPRLGSHRHVLHRGSDDYNSAAQEAAGAGIDINMADPNSTAASLAMSGRMGEDTTMPLPVMMNPGVFLHPYRNDLIFFFQTEAAQKNVVGYDLLYLESLALDDLPTKEWMRITIVVNGQVVDIYRNGELEKTLVLKGVLRNVPNAWYGRSGTVPFYGIVQNLKLYDGPLTAAQAKADGRRRLPEKPKLRASGVCMDP